MTRHTLLRIGAASLAALSAWAGFLCMREDRHYVLLVLIDTLRRDALGCYGNPEPVSPRIDAVAAEGVRFDQAISTSGWTLPAVASLMTGTWPTIHGAAGKGAALTPIRPELPTAAEILRDHGFATLAVANAAFISPMLGMDRGFDVYNHRHAYNHEIRRADETVDTALRQIRGHLDRSLFSFIHIFDVHADYDPPPGYRTTFTHGRQTPVPPLSLRMCIGMERDAGRAPPTPEDIAYIRGVYEGEVRFVDAQVGRLIDQLKAADIYDRTTLIITADHGEEFWDHGGFEHGHTVYDELIHIPLIVKPEDSVQPTVHVVETQVRILDIMPTVFDIAGIPKPASFDGESMLGLLRGRSAGPRIAFSEKTLYGADRLSWRSGRYDLIVGAEPGPEAVPELYDLGEDPREAENIIERRPEVASALLADLTTFYEGLKSRADTLSRPEVRDMRPGTIESLKSLGYIR